MSAVAMMVRSPTEYAAAERVAGPSVGAIAMDLEAATWVIEAHQRHLLLNRYSR